MDLTELINRLERIKDANPDDEPQVLVDVADNVFSLTTVKLDDGDVVLRAH